VTLADGNYHRTYFTVSPEDALAPGFPAYAAGGGMQSAGVAASYLKQLTRKWGLYSYAKYDRLVGSPANSPIVRQLGSRDQLSGGIGVTYTFGAN
jgi:MipA family protein